MKKLFILLALMLMLLPACGQTTQNEKEVVYVNITAEEAKKYVAETGVSALAVAVGTAHGRYKQAPKLAIERIKEIGVLRSVGARKKDISRVFKSEAVILGFVSGVIAIIVTAILCIIINIITKYIETRIFCTYDLRNDYF